MNETLQAGELLLEPTYEIGLVALSYCISVLGAFVALTAAQHRNDAWDDEDATWDADEDEPQDS